MVQETEHGEFGGSVVTGWGECPEVHDEGKEVWIADSAASCHMTPSSYLIESFGLPFLKVQSHSVWRMSLELWTIKAKTP